MSPPFLLCPVCFSILEHQAPPETPALLLLLLKLILRKKMFPQSSLRIISTTAVFNVFNTENALITWVCSTQGSRFSASMIIRLYLVSYHPQLDFPCSSQIWVDQSTHFGCPVGVQLWPPWLLVLLQPLRPCVSSPCGAGLENCSQLSNSRQSKST